MVEVDPKQTKRAAAFDLWMDAPMPMVTIFKTLDVTRLLKYSRKKNLKFNMLLCYCIGKAASDIDEFYLLPVAKKLIQYDSLAVNTIVMNKDGEVCSCDIPFCDDLLQFQQRYLQLTQQVHDTCTNHDLTDSMVIGTSSLAQYDIDGVVGMYTGIFNNPFLFWGRYQQRGFKTTLHVSFQFHHTQMDGAHAARFLDGIQAAMDRL